MFEIPCCIGTKSRIFAYARSFKHTTGFFSNIFSINNINLIKIELYYKNYLDITIILWI